MRWPHDIALAIWGLSGSHWVGTVRRLPNSREDSANVPFSLSSFCLAFGCWIRGRIAFSSHEVPIRSRELHGLWLWHTWATELMSATAYFLTWFSQCKLIFILFAIKHIPLILSKKKSLFLSLSWSSISVPPNSPENSLLHCKTVLTMLANRSLECEIIHVARGVFTLRKNPRRGGTFKTVEE